MGHSAHPAPMLLLVATAVLQASCRPQLQEQVNPLPSTATRVEATAATHLPSPMAPPIATSTSTPASVPSPTAPLPSTGPYLAYVTDQDGPVLNLLAPEANGSAEVRLPPEAAIQECVYCSVSPDAKWLVFWTGTLHEPQEPATEQYTLSLGLLSLADGASHTITGLLSHDYPMNFASNAATLSPDLGQDPQALAWDLEWAFNTGIRSARWSPNGRYLAFAGEMDGPSSDLYLFDTQTSLVRRLSSGRESIMSIEWSPDSQWIIQLSAFYVGEGGDYSFHATTPDGTQTRDFRLHGFFGGWLSTRRFFAYQAQNGPGEFALAVADVEEGESLVIWPDSFDDYAYDARNGILLLSSPGPFVSPDGPEAGLYFIPSASWSPRLISRGYWQVAYLGAPEAPFVASGGDIGTAFVSSYGDITSFSDRTFRMYPSPDHQAVALVGPYPDNPVWLYQTGGLLTQVARTARIFDVYWQPDSSAFFYESEGNLYCWGCGTPSAQQVDSGLRDSSMSYPAWVGG